MPFSVMGTRKTLRSYSPQEIILLTRRLGMHSDVMYVSVVFGRLGGVSNRFALVHPLS